MGLNIFIVVSVLVRMVFGLYSHGLLAAQHSGSCFRASVWVRSPPGPEPIETFCVGILDGKKLRAVGWMIPLFTGKKEEQQKQAAEG